MKKRTDGGGGRRRTSILITAAAILALAGVSAAKKPAPPPDDGGTYTHEVVDLGTPDGISVGMAVNSEGRVVGTWGGAYPETRGFFLDPEDTNGDGTPDRWFRDSDGDGRNDLMKDVPSPRSGGGFVYVVDVNDAGAIAGYAWVDEVDEYQNPREYGCLWRDADGDGELEASEAVVLGTLSGTDFSYPCAINADGLVVGSCGTYGGGLEGFVLVPRDEDADGKPDTWFANDGNGGNSLIFPLGPNVSAEGVSASGRICGRSGVLPMYIDPVDVDGDGVLEWFRDADGDGTNDLITLLPLPEDSTSGTALAVNASGEMAGTVGHSAFVWQPLTDGSWLLTDLGAPGERKGSGSAKGINASGAVVGNSYTLNWGKFTATSYTSFLWTGSTPQVFPDFVEGGAQLEARAVNDAGLIVGRDVETNRAFLVRPK